MAMQWGNLDLDPAPAPAGQKSTSPDPVGGV